LYEDRFHFPDALSAAHNRPPTKYIPVTAHAKQSRIQDPQNLPAVVFLWLWSLGQVRGQWHDFLSSSQRSVSGCSREP
jgi:hypothetical protein